MCHVCVRKSVGSVCTALVSTCLSLLHMHEILDSIWVEVVLHKIEQFKSGVWGQNNEGYSWIKVKVCGRHSFILSVHSDSSSLFTPWRSHCTISIWTTHTSNDVVFSLLEWNLFCRPYNRIILTVYEGLRVLYSKCIQKCVYYCIHTMSIRVSPMA